MVRKIDSDGCDQVCLHNNGECFEGSGAVEEVECSFENFGRDIVIVMLSLKIMDTSNRC